MTQLRSSTDGPQSFGLVTEQAATGLWPMCEPVDRLASALPSRMPVMVPVPAETRPVHMVAKILIIDDCTLQRESLAAILGRKGMPTPAVAWDLHSTRLTLDQMMPDVVLLSMATRDNFTLLRAVREKSPLTKIIVMGISEDDESDIVACAEAGIAGYHLRADSLDELLDVLAKVCSGEPACSPRVSAILLTRLSALAAQQRPGPTELVLTSREIQILRMLEMGLSNRDIADRLCITLHTVKNHVHSVLSKLGVSTRAEAAARFRSSQWA